MDDELVDVEVEQQADFRLDDDYFSMSSDAMPTAAEMEQVLASDNDIDEETKNLIRNMYKEDRMDNDFFIDPVYSSNDPSAPQSPSLQLSPGKANDIQNRRWSAEEKNAKHGRRWTDISKLLENRTPTQVKSFAHSYFKSQIKKGRETKNKSSKENNFTINHDDNIHVDVEQDSDNEFQVKKEKLENSTSINSDSPSQNNLSNDKKLSIENPPNNNALPSILSFANISNSTSSFENDFKNKKAVTFSESRDIDSDCTETDEELAKNEEEYENRMKNGYFPVAEYEEVVTSSTIKSILVEDMVALEDHNYSCVSFIQMLPEREEIYESREINSPAAPVILNSPRITTAGRSIIYDSGPIDEEEPNPNEIIFKTCEGRRIPITKPENEIELARDHISDEERRAHPEFFGSRPKKTPQRYIHLRNHIIDCWVKSKPKHLTKSAVRHSLQLGDVNAIGRIHCYLEAIGAINFNSASGPPKHSSSKLRRTIKRKTNIGNDITKRVTNRKMRVRDDDGNWVNLNDTQGRTICHSNDSDELPSKRTRRAPRVKISHDPFQLIMCNNFDNHVGEPFQLRICADALVLMDIHSHFCKTEVIGLLGGTYNEEEGTLTVRIAEACRSISTGTQCEMDAISQMEASEKILSQDCSVVGWYHSHPTFAPNPSLRDIETQQKYQEWFAQDTGCPFLGVIVNPYRQKSHNYMAEFRCLTVHRTPLHPSGLPYKFQYSIMAPERTMMGVVTQSARMIQKICSKADCYDLQCQFTNNLSYLEKILYSVRQHMDRIIDEDEIRDLMENLKTVLLRSSNH